MENIYFFGDTIITFSHSLFVDINTPGICTLCDMSIKIALGSGTT